MSNTVPAGYQPQKSETLPFYLVNKLPAGLELGGKPEEWDVEEVGDGNLNLVFIVKGLHKTLIVKQALPWLRVGGEGWPLSLSRSWFEYNVLNLERQYAGKDLVPQVYFYDKEMALFAMEYLTPHIILRKEFIAGKKFPNLSKHIGLFLANTLFHTSDIGMSAAEKKELVSKFSLNQELCKITEDLIFTEPYYNAERNNWTSPQLDNDVANIWQDQEMIQIAMRYKFKFMTEAQALLHGDLHSGSIMVTEFDTKVIDPEFGFMGPMAFDIGNYIGNLLLSFFSRPAWHSSQQEMDEYQNWLIEQIIETWTIFVHHFKKLWNEKTQGDAWPIEIYQQNLGQEALEQAQNQFFETLFEDSLVNAGMEINRRVIGFAGVIDLKKIADVELRAKCERRALKMARELIVNAKKFNDMSLVGKFAKGL